MPILIARATSTSAEPASTSSSVPFYEVEGSTDDEGKFTTAGTVGVILGAIILLETLVLIAMIMKRKKMKATIKKLELKPTTKPTE